MYAPIKQATAKEILFFVHDENGDPVTGLADGDFTKRISKNGSASFAAMTTSIAEAEGGWYNTTLSSSHTDTRGTLTIYFTHASAEQTNLQYEVSARDIDDLAFPTTSGRSIDVNSAGNVAIDLDNTSGTLAKGSEITGFNDPTAGSVADAVWDEAMADHVTSTSFGYIGSEITAILADTNELQTDLANGGRLDVILDAILLDTGSLQADWVDGGRLDVILDAIKTVADGLHNFDPTSDTVTVGTNNDKTGYALSAAGIDSIWDEVFESTYTARQFLRILLAVNAGKSTGGGSTTNNYRDVADTKNRVSATVDADGNRTARTLDAT